MEVRQLNIKLNCSSIILSTESILKNTSHIYNDIYFVGLFSDSWLIS